MPAVTIDAVLFKKMFLTGAKRLESKKEIINELNVFPVPDGDTGTNMTMTIMSAVKEVNKLNNPTMAELAKAISSGSLRGARGNSGVILPSFFVVCARCSVSSKRLMYMRSSLQSTRQLRQPIKQ